MIENLQTHQLTEEDLETLEQTYLRELEVLSKTVIEPNKDVIEYALRKIATLSEEEPISYFPAY